jgi:hypothetical protein
MHPQKNDATLSAHHSARFRDCVMDHSEISSWTPSASTDNMCNWKLLRNGVFMAKSLLILMLVTTQLLAGHSGTLYLCVSDDGSFCCIDTGSASCVCCHDEEKSAHASCCSDPECEEKPTESQQLGLSAGDPCGCTHIPVMVSADQPATVSRSSIMTESERLSLHIALLSASFVYVEVVAPSPHLCWSGPPAVPDFALTVISTVVIRC